MQRSLRRVIAPTLALAGLALATTVAAAHTGQPKPNVSAEAERTPQGAKITVRGKNWPAKARIKLTATRAPGTRNPQDFGMIDADDKGEVRFSVVKQCTTNRMEDAELDPVTFTATDSATGVKATSAKVNGGGWVCQ
ncbi:MAG: hypothetical protein LCH84_10430 [Gemmatimonadetes bacterium]|nr:hypothetical protein [Gemmatimonadota bacterium]